MKSSFHWGMKSAKTALNNYLYPRWGNLVWFIFPSYCLQSAKHWAKYIFFFFFFCYFCLFVRLLHFFFLCRNCLNSPHSLFSLCAASLSRWRESDLRAERCWRTCRLFTQIIISPTLWTHGRMSHLTDWLHCYVRKWHHKVEKDCQYQHSLYHTHGPRTHLFLAPLVRKVSD